MKHKLLMWSGKTLLLLAGRAVLVVIVKLLLYTA